eukprot:3612996-Pyramimonas_sp.AAC.1
MCACAGQSHVRGQRLLGGIPVVRRRLSLDTATSVWWCGIWSPVRCTHHTATCLGALKGFGASAVVGT